jgi:hypothetical protein
MALIAEDARDRAEQLSLITERLTAHIVDETRRLQAREAPAAGADSEEKHRLVNTYRLELTRIKQDPSLIAAAPAALHARLRTATLALQEALAAHELELGALRFVTEGLVQAMAEEVARQRAGSRSYGAHGGVEAPTGPSPALIDRSA